MAWRNSTDNKARAMLAEAMVIEEARVMPPAPPPGTTNDPTATAASCRAPIRPRRPSSKRRCRSSRPPPMRIPSNEAGLTARYHAAKTLVDARPVRRGDQAVRPGDRRAARRCSRAWRASARPKRSCARRSTTRRSPRFKEIVEQKDASLPAEAVLMELARAYRLAGKTEDARKTLHADGRAARRLAVCDRSEGRAREAEGLDSLTITDDLTCR